MMASMRRLVASFLAVLFTAILLAPVVLANPEKNLPSCCRRDGKHHCSSMKAQAESHHGPTVRSEKMRCAQYPFAGVSSVVAKVAPPAAGPAMFAAVVSHPAVQAQTEARQRTSFTRTCQKRGPPSLLS